MTTDNYSADDIVKLSDRDHVRLRTQIYLGNMNVGEYDIPVFIHDKFEIKKMKFIPAVYKAVGEVLDNCTDEHKHFNQKNKKIKINADSNKGEYIIADNGRGIPLERHKEGKLTPEIALGSLRTGRNFQQSKVGIFGANGVGVSVVNMCSTQLNVEIFRGGKRYQQTFKDGTNYVSKPKIVKAAASKRGTSVSFNLDPLVFKQVSLPDELMKNRACEIAFNNPDVEVSYNDTVYKYKKGIEEIVKNISQSYVVFESNNMKFYIIFDLYEGTEEKVFTWVNGSLLFDGGLCNTQFVNAFVTKTIDHLAAQAKKAGIVISKNNIKENLLIFGTMDIANPEYDNQAKTRMTGPNLRQELTDLVEENWAKFARSKKDWLSEVIDRASASFHATTNKKAIKEHQKNINKKIIGLLDANNKDRSSCQILITEGESAASSIKEVRDPKTTASLALTGKINNVYGMTASQILQLGKLTQLLAAIGLIPGQYAIRKNLRYGKIVIATDADPDGSDIFTLIINLLFQFWPELFENEKQPVVYRLICPNVVASKGNTRLHFPTLAEFEAVKEKYKGYTVTYMKGLGSMDPADWRLVLQNPKMFVPIIDDGTMVDVLKLLFSNDADMRKKWLQK